MNRKNIIWLSIVLCLSILIIVLCSTIIPIYYNSEIISCTLYSPSPGYDGLRYTMRVYGNGQYVIAQYTYYDAVSGNEATVPEEDIAYPVEVHNTGYEIKNFGKKSLNFQERAHLLNLLMQINRTKKESSLGSDHLVEAVISTCGSRYLHIYHGDVEDYVYEGHKNSDQKMLSDQLINTLIEYAPIEIEWWDE